MCQARKRKPPLTVQRSRQAPRKTWLNCAMIRQPTLVVAWVGICWHASAHKGCPVFPRWAPGLNTIAEADDRYCRVEATVVIRHHNQVEQKRELNSAEEEAPNSKSLTELPGANRSWVAVGGYPKLLQQIRQYDVKPSGPFIRRYVEHDERGYLLPRCAANCSTVAKIKARSLSFSPLSRPAII